MLIILAAHTLLDVIGLVLQIWSLNPFGFVISLIISLISFFFIAYCLVRIGEAEGERMVMKCNVVSVGIARLVLNQPGNP